MSNNILLGFGVACEEAVAGISPTVIDRATRNPQFHSCIRSLIGQLSHEESEPGELEIEISVGSHRKIGGLLKELYEAGHSIWKLYEDLTPKVELSGRKSEAKIVLISHYRMVEFFRAHGHCLDNFQALGKVRNAGYIACTAEQGLYLPLYLPPVQPQGQEMERIMVAMEPIVDTEGNRYIITLEKRGDGCWIPFFTSSQARSSPDRDWWAFLDPS